MNRAEPIDFAYDLTEDERDIVRHNWQMLGYRYWATRDMIEMWKHPDTNRVIEMATY